jgi:hypothetical protein
MVLANQRTSPFQNRPGYGTGVVYPVAGALPIKKSHAADAFQKEKCAGCGEALPFFAIIIYEKARFCQDHFTKNYKK